MKSWNRLPISWIGFYTVLLAFCLGLAACNEPAGEDDEQGGVHVPEDKTYAVTALPEGADRVGVSPVEYATSYLAKFVHVSERYRVCLGDEFTDEELTAFQSFVVRKPTDVDNYGIEPLVNHALTTIDMYDKSKGRFSSRIQVEIVRASGRACDLVITRQVSGVFPFDETFPNADRLLFSRGQLVRPDSATNSVPVGFVRDKPISELKVPMQYAVSKYLGMADSSRQGSYLHPETTDLMTDKGWFVSSNGQVIAGRDSLIVYGYALAYADVLKPEDFERYHHYQDTLHPREPALDPDLPQEAGTPIPYRDLVGHPFLNGARLTKGTVKICVDDLAQTGISPETVTQLFDFVDHERDGSLPHHLHALAESFVLKAEVASQACELIVSFRTEAHFPFASRQLNGLYAHEGSVKGPSGSASALPIIYLNTDNLELDPEAQASSSKKYAGLVLQHEFAHFLGMKHSSSKTSILSPAGYNTSFEPKGADKSIFEAFIEEWSRGGS